LGKKEGRSKLLKKGTRKSLDPGRAAGFPAARVWCWLTEVTPSRKPRIRFQGLGKGQTAGTEIEKKRRELSQTRPVLHLTDDRRRPGKSKWEQRKSPRKDLSRGGEKKRVKPTPFISGWD